MTAGDVAQRRRGRTLAQMLPQLIDKFTPNGKIPDDQDDVVAQALAILTQTKTG